MDAENKEMDHSSAASVLGGDSSIHTLVQFSNEAPA